jgi:hypothetical protein
MKKEHTMTARERVTLALQHHEADRIPMQDSLWSTTLHRWQQEGLPEMPPHPEYLGWELAGFGDDETLQLPAECLEETEAYRITKGPDGAIVKNWTAMSSTPEMIDFSIKTRADWEELKPRMAWNDRRVNWEGQRQAR